MPKVDEVNEADRKFSGTISYVKDNGLCIIGGVSSQYLEERFIPCVTFHRLIMTPTVHWGKQEVIPWEKDTLSGFFPADGYYNTFNFVFWYGRSSKRQWKLSLSTEGKASVFYKLPSPPHNVFEQNYNSLLQEAEVIRDLSTPVYPKLENILEIEKDLLSGKLCQVAFCRHIAFSIMFHGAPPIVFYRGVVAGHLKDGIVHLTPYTSCLKEDMEQYLEVVCHQ